MARATLFAATTCLVVLGILVAVFTSSDVSAVMQQKPAANTAADSGTRYGYAANHKDPDQFRQANSRAEQRLADWEAASPHHWRIAGWILECSNIREVGNLPVYLRDFFNPFNTDYTVRASTARLPHHHEMALLQLSRAIGDHRVSLSGKSDDTLRKAKWATYATVILGFITTIVVSFNSSALAQSQSGWAHASRFLAIVLTASGTALAAIIAFHNPQAEWNDTKRMLSSLAELHNFIGLETWKMNCLEFQGTELKADSKTNTLVVQKFEEWTKRYNDLQATLGGTNPTANAPGAGPSSQKPPGT